MKAVIGNTIKKKHILRAIDIKANLKSRYFMPFVLVFDLNSFTMVIHVNMNMAMNGMMVEKNKSIQYKTPLSTIKHDI
jgi:hypothetical protein